MTERTQQLRDLTTKGQSTQNPAAEQEVALSPEMKHPSISHLNISNLGIRRFGKVNWLGFWTFYQKEVQRFLKVVFQTVFAPVMSTLLFLLVFMLAPRPNTGELPYIVFLAPGLIMMAIITNSFSNSSSSLIIGKMQGSIVDILMAPLSAAELAFGFVAGAMTRGLLVGLVTAVTSAGFMAFSAPMPVTNVFAILYFSVITAMMFGTLGLISGLWAEKFDQLSAITNFVIQPLTFLSGTFYAISRLPEPFLSIGKVNPIFMLVDGFRYGFTGEAEASLWVSVVVTFTINAVLFYTAYRLLKSGWKIKS